MLIHFKKLVLDLFPRVVNELLTRLALLIEPYVSLQFIRLFTLLPIALRGEANRLPFVLSLKVAVATELQLTISDVGIVSSLERNSFTLIIAKRLSPDEANDIQQLVDGYRLAGTLAIIDYIRTPEE